MSEREVEPEEFAGRAKFCSYIHSASFGVAYGAGPSCIVAFGIQSPTVDVGVKVVVNILAEERLGPEERIQLEGTYCKTNDGLVECPTLKLYEADHTVALMEAEAHSKAARMDLHCVVLVVAAAPDVRTG